MLIKSKRAAEFTSFFFIRPRLFRCRSALAPFFVACAILSAGCATQAIQQGAEFATAGANYSAAVIGFIDVYLTTRIDVNSRRAPEDRLTSLDAQLGSELPAKLTRQDTVEFITAAAASAIDIVTDIVSVIGG